jgi:proline iminopeptidase
MQRFLAIGCVSSVVAMFLAAPVVVGQESWIPREVRIPAGAGSLYARDIGQGEAAIVLHGGPDFDSAYLLPELDRLADIFRLVYFDQRGRGRSADWVRAEEISLATDLDDIERVRNHFSLEAPTLVAHSWGTVLALEYALRYPTRVSRLILLNPAPASAADAELLGKAYTARLGDAMKRQRTIVTGQAYLDGDPEAVAERYRIHFKHALAKKEHYEPLMRAMRAAFLLQGPTGILKARAVESRLMADTWQQPDYDLTSRISTLQIPALVVWGNRDFIPRQIAEHVAGTLPQARMVTIEDCGHFAYMECPAAVRTALLDFARQPPIARRW